MDGLYGKTLLYKMDDLGVPLFLETPKSSQIIPKYLDGRLQRFPV